MARRQHTLTSSVSRSDAAGNATTFDLIRQLVWHENPMSKCISIQWELGKLVDGAWISSGLSGVKHYEGAAYDTLLAVETSSGQEDQVYADLVTDGVIGAGNQGNYP